MCNVGNLVFFAGGSGLYSGLSGADLSGFGDDGRNRLPGAGDAEDGSAKGGMEGMVSALELVSGSALELVFVLDGPAEKNPSIPR